MSRATEEKSDHPHAPPKPVVKKMRRPVLLIWLVLVFALGMVGYYIYDHFASRGREIAIKFDEADGLKTGQTQLMHRGVSIGEVTDIQITQDQRAGGGQNSAEARSPLVRRKGGRFCGGAPEISTDPSPVSAPF